MNQDYYPHPGQPQPQPEPEKKGMGGFTKGFLFGCLPILVVGGIAFAGCTALVGGAVNEVDKAIEADQKEDQRALHEDVELVDCKVVNDELLGREVKGKVRITNNGDKRATYLVTGEFLDDNGDKIDELLASVDDLEPGKSSTQNFTNLITSDQLKGVQKGTCKVLDVDRSEMLAKGD